MNAIKDLINCSEALVFFDLRGVLVTVTILVGIVFLIWYYHKEVALVKKENVKSRKNAVNKFRVTLIGTIIIVYALVNSYKVYFTRIENFSNTWPLVTPSILFALVFFINILLLSWAFSLLSSILNPERVAEFGAKFFGFEVNQKYLPVRIQEDLEKVDIQLKVIADINATILEYISSPFEKNILEAENYYDEIRQIVYDKLSNIYKELPGIIIYVLPLNMEEINSLPDRIATIVREKIREGVNSTQVEYEKIGISIHLGTEGAATTIVIDAMDENYDLSLAEISAAGNLFVSITLVVDAS